MPELSDVLGSPHETDDIGWPLSVGTGPILLGHVIVGISASMKVEISSEIQFLFFLSSHYKSCHEINSET